MKRLLYKVKEALFFAREKAIFLLVIFHLSIYSFGQLTTPQTPNFSVFQPVIPQTTSPDSYQPTYYQFPTPPPTANQIIEQQYQQLDQQIGIYHPRPYMSLEENRKAQQAFQYRKIQQQKGYYHPTAENHFKQLSPDMAFQTELLHLLQEVSTVNQQVIASGYYSSGTYLADIVNYENAFIALKNMLEGKYPISLADAFFIEESAYGNLHLTYQEYQNIISQSAAFMQQYMRENGLPLNNPEAVHLTIQKFMGDTLQLKSKRIDNGSFSIPSRHLPFVYDYIDYRAEKDLRNYFLTKTLATGSGQCNTLPRVYLVLAEAMGVEAYLSFGVQHSFIKYKNSQGVIHNYEPTIDWHMSDQDYMDEMPVIAEALKNRIYFDTLNKKQIVASIIIDLAYNFYREHWVADSRFMLKNIDYAMSYFHNSVAHEQGLILKSLVLASQLDRALLQVGITNLADIEKDSAAYECYIRFRENEMLIKKLGIQPFPETKYQAMLEKHDHRGRLQTAKKINVKSKKSLFFNF